MAVRTKSILEVGMNCRWRSYLSQSSFQWICTIEKNGVCLRAHAANRVEVMSCMKRFIAFWEMNLFSDIRETTKIIFRPSFMPPMEFGEATWMGSHEIWKAELDFSHGNFCLIPLTGEMAQNWVNTYTALMHHGIRNDLLRKSIAPPIGNEMQNSRNCAFREEAMEIIEEPVSRPFSQ